MSATLTSAPTQNTYGLSKVHTGKTIDINLIPDGSDIRGRLTLSIRHGVYDGKAVIRTGGWDDVVCISNDLNKITSCITKHMGNSVQTNSVNRVILDAIADIHAHKWNLMVTISW